MIPLSRPSTRRYVCLVVSAAWLAACGETTSAPAARVPLTPSVARDINGNVPPASPGVVEVCAKGANATFKVHLSGFSLGSLPVGFLPSVPAGGCVNVWIADATIQSPITQVTVVMQSVEGDSSRVPVVTVAGGLGSSTGLAFATVSANYLQSATITFDFSQVPPGPPAGALEVCTVGGTGMAYNLTEIIAPSGTPAGELVGTSSVVAGECRVLWQLIGGTLNPDGTWTWPEAEVRISDQDWVMWDATTPMSRRVGITVEGGLQVINSGYRERTIKIDRSTGARITFTYAPAAVSPPEGSLEVCTVGAGMVGMAYTVAESNFPWIGALTGEQAVIAGNCKVLWTANKQLVQNPDGSWSAPQAEVRISDQDWVQWDATTPLSRRVGITVEGGIQVVQTGYRERTIKLDWFTGARITFTYAPAPVSPPEGNLEVCTTSGGVSGYGVANGVAETTAGLGTVVGIGWASPGTCEVRWVAHKRFTQNPDGSWTAPQAELFITDPDPDGQMWDATTRYSRRVGVTVEGGLQVTSLTYDKRLVKLDYLTGAKLTYSFQPWTSPLKQGDLVICSNGAAGRFTVSQSGAAAGTINLATVDVAVGTCATVWTATRNLVLGSDLSAFSPPTTVAVTEQSVLTSGYQLGSVLPSGGLGSTTTSNGATVAMDWFQASQIDFNHTPIPVLGQGCSPGYWKNHPSTWVTYRPGDNFNAVFGTSFLGPNVTLMGALGLSGGDKNALARQAVGALLNAASLYPKYELTTTDVIARVRAAQQMNTYAPTKSALEALTNVNGRTCPLP